MDCDTNLSNGHEGMDCDGIIGYHCLDTKVMQFEIESLKTVDALPYHFDV